MHTRLPLLLALAACSASPNPPSDTAPTGDSGSATTVPTIEAAIAVDDDTPTWIVTWTTSEAVDSWVEFGTTEAMDRRATSVGGQTSHEVRLVGVKANTPYYWRAVSELADGELAVSETATVAPIPSPLGMILPTLTVSEPGSAVAQGVVQLSQIQTDGTTWLTLFDGEGDLVWWQEGEAGSMIVTGRPARNGTDLLYAEWDLFNFDGVGWLHRVALDGTARSATALPAGHHDFHEWADGTLGYFEHQANTTTRVITDGLMERPEGAAAAEPATSIWSWADDYAAGLGPGCNHTMAPWPQDTSFTESTHSNSLMVDSSGEHYFAMSKFRDTLLKIRRSDGALIWQLNGASGDFTMFDGSDPWTAVGDSQLWSHAHMSQLTVPPAGSGHDLCLEVFDNGQHYVPELSSIKQICLDEAGLRAEVTWSHAGVGVTPLMGDVRLLEGGTRLVAWASLHKVEEIAEDGTVLWQLTYDPPPGPPPPFSTGRVSLLPAF